VLASSGFVLMTIVTTGQFLRVIDKFAQIFKELGVQIPRLTEVVLNPWTHVISGAFLLALVALRHRPGKKEWATAAWVVALLGYIAISHMGLFEPLIRLIDNLGKQASG
jgi:type II secretory pathway component PulF